MRHQQRLAGSLLCLILAGFVANWGFAQDRPKAQTDLFAALDHFIAHEVKDKGLPALAIALVNDQQTVWAKAYGTMDAKGHHPATIDAVFRVGSVSKLFTDLAIMREVEAGRLNLDAPITDVLPDFQPQNPWDGVITLRHLMSHRSGLVREPPVGHYFDDTNPSLADTVGSLNRTALVYPPGKRIKYSNAGIAVVGRVLEVRSGQPFTAFLQKQVLEPLGLTRSHFELQPTWSNHVPHAEMWTYHGRRFAAPRFELGMAPAGSMYAPVTDLAKFLHFLFAGGRGPNGAFVQPATVGEMLKPQFPGPDGKSGFGIGFMLGELDGARRVGHGGAIYGFATELAALPDLKLGVAVAAAKDVANPVTTRIADEALRVLRAIKAGQAWHAPQATVPVGKEQAVAMAGVYRHGDRALELTEESGRLMVLPLRGGFKAELRRRGMEFVTDDVVDVGTRIQMTGDKLQVGTTEYLREPNRVPTAPPERWLGLIGEYGWDHNILYILEKDGQLYALIEWFFFYPLEDLGKDRFAFPNHGLYHGEQLVFHRGADGRATKVTAAGIDFVRRRLVGESGKTYQITPRRPIAELRQEARAATPPRPQGELAEPDLVDLKHHEPTLQLDIRYATDDNFLATPVYTSARAFLQRPAANALREVHRELEHHGVGLRIHDAYRPWHVTKIFWEATPDVSRGFVADPTQGSRHNRGCAVDLTLFDRATGQAVAMVSGYDEFSDRAYPFYPGGTSRQRWYRDLLRTAMERHGFTVFEAEWWHFDHRDWKKYPIMNTPFERVPPAP